MKNLWWVAVVVVMFEPILVISLKLKTRLINTLADNTNTKHLQKETLFNTTGIHMRESNILADSNFKERSF